MTEITLLFTTILCGVSTGRLLAERAWLPAALWGAATLVQVMLSALVAAR